MPVFTVLNYTFVFLYIYQYLILVNYLTLCDGDITHHYVERLVNLCKHTQHRHSDTPFCNHLEIWTCHVTTGLQNKAVVG